MTPSVSPEVPIPSLFIGCDVSKETISLHRLDVGSGTRASLGEIANDKAAIKAFVSELRGHPQAAHLLVICEATGGHEMALLLALESKAIPAHRADARKVKAFIRSYGTRAKTDKLDAKALADYGAERHQGLIRWKTPTRLAQRLASLVSTRQDLVKEKTAWTNRAKAPGGESAIFTRLAKVFDEQIKSVDETIKKLIDSSPELKQQLAILTAIKGIGRTTAQAILAFMPEIGTLNRRQAASLAGLAPHPRQSGKSDAYRHTSGGRKPLKKALFMAAITAAKHNQDLKNFNTRLRQNGKKPLQAITAVMRKLITIANAKIRDHKTQIQVS